MPRKNKIKAVLFDMDGVIIDSMPYHFIAWYEALLPYGVRLSCFDIFMREGENWRKSLRELLAISGLPPTESLLDKIFKERQKIFKKYFKPYVFKDARELICDIKKRKVPLALVTGTPKDAAEKILPGDIRRKFDIIIGGDCVKRGKPYPDPYLAAAAKLGVDPSECYVIENAPLGILAAKRAKMFVAAVTTSLPKQYLRRADIIVGSLSCLKGRIIPG